MPPARAEKLCVALYTSGWADACLLRFDPGTADVEEVEEVLPNVTKRKLAFEAGAIGGLSCWLTTWAQTDGSELLLCCCSVLAFATIGIWVGTELKSVDVVWDEGLDELCDTPAVPFAGEEPFWLPQV